MSRKRLFLMAIMTCIVMLALVVIYSSSKTEQSEKAINIQIFPSFFYILENSTQDLTVAVTIDNLSASNVPVLWYVESTGNTGSISLLDNHFMTDERGTLTATYITPTDLDEPEQNVSISATISIDGKTYTARAHATLYPLLHETRIRLETEYDSIIAGEKNTLSARLYANESGLIPLANATLILHCFSQNQLILEDTSVTNAQGECFFPFFYSNIEHIINVTAEVSFLQDLSRNINYDGCTKTCSFILKPEKPGDFPVVLIHGWTGSITDSFLNYTWWNLTKKLVAQNFTVLDFDVTRPGIQWLEYEPDWFEEHHIPWITARVCEKITRALVLNGYPVTQTIDIVAHSMGGLVAQFMVDQYGADTDYWNKNWNGTGMPWYGDGDIDITIGPFQIDDLIAVGTPMHGVPPYINETFLKMVIRYGYFPWWIGQTPDMVYEAPFLTAMNYQNDDLIDYYGVGGDIGVIFGDQPVDFNGDGIPHYSDGLVPAESPYLEGKPLLLLEGKAWPFGMEDHLSLITINDTVHQYIIKHLIL